MNEEMAIFQFSIQSNVVPVDEDKEFDGIGPCSNINCILVDMNGRHSIKKDLHPVDWTGCKLPTLSTS